MSENSPADTNIACPITGDLECKEPTCLSQGCYLQRLRMAGRSDAELQDLIDEVSDVD